MALTQASEGGLKISNAGTNGQYLQKQTGNTGGLTWADVPAGVGGATGVDFNDNVKIRFGTGNDLGIYHSGTNTFIENSTGPLKIRSDTLELGAANGEQMLQGTANSAVNLYYDGSKKFETTSAGTSVSGQLSVGDLHINYSGTGEHYWTQADAKQTIFRNQTGTQRSFITTAGDYKNQDGIKFIAGTGEDLQIFHDGTGCNIRSTSSKLEIRSADLLLQDSAAEKYFRGVSNGAVHIYYDNAVKINTNAAGVTVSGNVDISNGHLEVRDDYKARFGNSQDLQIYHDNSGGHNHIHGATNCPIIFKTNDSERCRITSSGDLNFENDSSKITFGTGQDLKIYHNGNHSYIKDSGTGNLILSSNQTQILNAAENELTARFDENGAVELYYDGTKKFQTTSGGAEILGHLLMNDSNEIQLGSSGDLKIYHNGSHNYIEGATSGQYTTLRNVSGNIIIQAKSGENSIWCGPDSDVELYYDGSKKFETRSGGCFIAGHLELEDSNKVMLGTGNDLQLYHDGNNSFIENAGTGSLNLYGDEVNILNKARSEYKAKFISNGAVELYYDNSKKVETQSDGIRITPGGSSATVNLSTSTSGDEISLAANKDGTDATRLSFKAQASGGSSVEKLEVNSTSIILWDDVYIGNSDSTGGHLTVQGKGGNSEPAKILLKGKNSSSGNNPLAQIQGVNNTYAWASDLRFFTRDHNINDTEHFRIDFQGNLTATDTTIGSISDSRLKTNIANYTYDLAKFKQFQPKTFDWKNPVQHGGKSGVRGFLAQDLEAVDSSYVSSYLVEKTVTKGNEDGTTTTSTHPDLQYLDSDGMAKSSKFGPKDAMYISIINQLITKIETLETKVAALEGD